MPTIQIKIGENDSEDKGSKEMLSQMMRIIMMQKASIDPLVELMKKKMMKNEPIYVKNATEPYVG